MTVTLTRRTLLATALTAGAAVPLGAAAVPLGAAGPAWAMAPAMLTLPRPTGPYRIGTVSLHLVDRSRPDPVAGAGRHRELMISVWYPAAASRQPLASRHPPAPWMTASSMRALLADNGFDADAAAAPRTVARESFPVLRGRFPVVLYSHGAGGHRSETTDVVQELASHGYVVVTVDHTYDAYTSFPDGRVSVPDDDLPVTPWDHADDIVFVLDRIEDLAAGRNPDAARRPLPVGLGAALDLRHVGMFGWSKGGTATALVMNVDPRVRAGLAFDGPMESQPPVADLNRPFMLMTAQFPRPAEPAVEQFWSLLHGWRRTLQIDGAPHGAYCDQQWLIPQLAQIVGMSAEDLAEWIGSLDPARAVRIQQAYPLAFFDQHLRGRRQHLLDGPGRAFPEVRFIP
jgi:dienelactone hydrolase